MPNQASAARVICPFYLRDGSGAVACEGIGESNATLLRFEKEQNRLRWMAEHCERHDFGEVCPLAEMLARKYQREEGTEP